MKVEDLLPLPALAPLGEKRFPRLVFRIQEALGLVAINPGGRKPDPRLAAALAPRISADIRLIGDAGTLRLGLIFLDGEHAGVFLDRRTDGEKNLSVHISPDSRGALAGLIAAACVDISRQGMENREIEEEHWWSDDLILTPTSLSSSPVTARVSISQQGDIVSGTGFAILTRQNGTIHLERGGALFPDALPASPDEQIEVIMQAVGQLLLIPREVTNLTYWKMDDPGPPLCNMSLIRRAGKTNETIEHNYSSSSRFRVVATGPGAEPAFRSACEAALREALLVP